MKRYTLTWYEPDGTPHCALNLTPGALVDLQARVLMARCTHTFSTRQDFEYRAEECEAAMAQIREGML